MTTFKKTLFIKKHTLITKCDHSQQINLLQFLRKEVSLFQMNLLTGVALFVVVSKKFYWKNKKTMIILKIVHRRHQEYVVKHALQRNKKRCTKTSGWTYFLWKYKKQTTSPSRWSIATKIYGNFISSSHKKKCSNHYFKFSYSS